MQKLLKNEFKKKQHKSYHDTHKKSHAFLLPNCSFKTVNFHVNEQFNGVSVQIEWFSR